MRVGLIIYGGLDTVSGGFLYDRVLVDHLRERDDEVEIISLPWRSYAGNISDNWSARLMARLEEQRFDLMLQDELNHPSLFRLNRKLRRSYPIVSIVHHLRSSEMRAAWRNRLYRVVEKRYLRSVDGFVFNSQTTQGVVQGLVGESQPSVVAHPAGDRFRPDVTPQWISERARAPGPLRVLFLGNVIPRKELHTLIDALARLPGNDWCLDVVGSLAFDVDYVRSIRRRIAEARLERNVTLQDTLLDDDLAEHLKQSQLLIVPSSYEGFGIVYLEGMSFGLPSIASTAGAAHEVVDHGHNGFLITPGDVEALSRHISELAQDRDRLAVMGVAALQSYAAHPTWRDTASRIRDFLTSVVQQHNAVTT